MIINMNGAKAPETPSPVLQEKTVTPATLPTVIGADEGYTGLSQVTVNPDTNLKAENIRSGKTIFGVGGTFEGTVEMTGGIPFDCVYQSGDNKSTVVLHRFNADELIATDEKAPGTAYSISYGTNPEGVQGSISYYDATNKHYKGRFSPVLTNSTNSSWWSSHFITPSVVVPAQTVAITYDMIGGDFFNNGARMLVRFAVGVAQTVSSTDDRARGGSNVANEKSNIHIIDVEMAIPDYNSPVQLEIPEMTIAPTHIRNNTDPYAVLMCMVSWMEI